MEWSHNHSVQSLHSLSFKDISDSVIRRIEGMFARGLLPGTAYHELLRQLRSECNFQKVLSRGVPILFIVRDPSIAGAYIKWNGPINTMHRICQIHICLCYTGCTVEGFGFPRFIIKHGRVQPPCIHRGDTQCLWCPSFGNHCN